MKVQHLLLIFLFLFSCQTDSKKEVVSEDANKETAIPKPKAEKIPTPWEMFWKDFQGAVVAGEVNKVASHITFPLKGSELFNNGKPVDQANFKELFPKIFDPTVVEMFKEGVTNMSEFATKNKTVADQLNVPVNTKIRTTMVLYVTNKGKKNQTESSLTFQFVEVAPSVFKLYSLVTAG